jgi:hypothetical protein
MKLKYRFVDEALEEFIAAGRYYNQQVPGLGDAFVDEVETGIEIILQGPDGWRVIEDDVRRYLIQRFPYGMGSTPMHLQMSNPYRRASILADAKVIYRVVRGGAEQALSGEPRLANR